MSGFLRKGRRKETKRIKKHVKEFYKIIGEMDDVAQKIVKNKRVDEVNEDTIEDIAFDYTNRNIGNMEKMLLLSKLNKDGGSVPDKKK